jgi:outer membrane protein TolC
MPLPFLRSSFHRLAPLAIATLALAPVPAAMGQISFYTAVDLALRNSHEVKMATADVDRAIAGLAQTKDAYIPNLTLGSSLGYSYGFPVGQPSVYNVSSNSLLLSFSQPDLVRSARASLEAARAAMRDTRDKVVAETALCYIEMDTDTRELQALDEQHSFGDRLVEIQRERNTAGLSSTMDVTQAELTNAQLELRRLHLQDHLAVLRLRLADLTGLGQDTITSEPSSIPGGPEPLPSKDLNQALYTRNAALAASEADARAKQYLAFADRHKILRPEIAFGIQYSRYAKFNNYAEYYLRFQHNNFDVGINMSLPLYDASARDRARGSAADAVHAREQSSVARLQLTEQSQELASSIAELRAQQKVARLQSDYAQENLDAVATQLQNGSGSPNAAQLTPSDEQKARIEERRRYVDKLDADFQIVQAQVQLARSLGNIEEWARQAPQKHGSTQ